MGNLGTLTGMATVLTTDSRGRVTLPGRANSTYLLKEEPDGTLVLEPAVVVSELERRVLANAGLAARLADAREHPERAVPRTKRRR